MSDDVERGEIRLRDVSRKYRVLHERNQTLKEAIIRGRRVRGHDHWVLKNVDLDIHPGEAVGIIGRNGIGKSTLLKLVAGIIPPQSGAIKVGGVVAPLLELGAGFHIDFTGRENVEMQGALYGLSPAQITERFDDIVEFSELGEYIDMPVRTYSSGMFMRLAFSIAAHVDADILLLDEVLAVGDVAFQKKCVARIAQLRTDGATLLFVSHSREAVESVCERCILLDYGSVVCDGSADAAFAAYANSLRTAGHQATAAVGHEADRAGASWGSQRLRITEVELFGDSGPTDNFVPGQNVRIALRVATDDVISGPVFGLSISTDAGQAIGGLTSRDSPLSQLTIRGDEKIVLELPELALREGRFVVSVFAESADGSELFHRREGVAGFSVFDDVVGYGPVNLDGRWTTEAESTTSPRDGL